MAIHKVAPPPVDLNAIPAGQFASVVRYVERLGHDPTPEMIWGYWRLLQNLTTD
jgi:hypothetical protein